MGETGRSGGRADAAAGDVSVPLRAASLGSAPPGRRPLGLSAFILLLGVGTLTGIVTQLSGRMEMLAAVERGHPALRGLYYLIAPMNLVSLAGLWWWRRWAIWLTLLLAGTCFVTETLLGMPIVHIVRVPIVLTFLMLLVWRHRRRFS